MASKLIISCAVLGAELTKNSYPSLPVTPEELSQSAIEAVNAGASIIHLHVRDKAQKPSQDKEIFKEVTKLIKNRCDCIIQYSTGGAVGTPVKDRCGPLSLKPEMATLSMGSLNFGNEIFENTEDIIQAINKEIIVNGVMPELEIFDYGMMDTVDRYLKKNILPEKFHVDFVLGVPGGMNGEIKSLTMLTDRLRVGQEWSVAGISKYQLPLTAHAIAMGGHIRVGLEDNIYYRKGELCKNNAQFVERVVRIAKELDRPVASVKEAREILKLT